MVLVIWFFLSAILHIFTRKNGLSPVLCRFVIFKAIFENVTPGKPVSNDKIAIEITSCGPTELLQIFDTEFEVPVRKKHKFTASG